MYNKLLSSLLVIAFLNLIGCYSSREVTLNEILTNDEISEITITTKDSLRLSFEENDFYFSSDTLKGKSSHSRTSEKTERAIPLSDITSFESIEFDGAKTFGTTAILLTVVGGIVLIIYIVESFNWQ
jgi:hypothetical protein